MVRGDERVHAPCVRRRASPGLPGTLC